MRDVLTLRPGPGQPWSGDMKRLLEEEAWSGVGRAPERLLIMDEAAGQLLERGHRKLRQLEDLMPLFELGGAVLCGALWLWPVFP